MAVPTLRNSRVPRILLLSCFTVYVLIADTGIPKAAAFSLHPLGQQRTIASVSSSTPAAAAAAVPSPLRSALPWSLANGDAVQRLSPLFASPKKDEDPDKRDLVPVRRRKGSSRYYDEEEEAEAEGGKEANYYDEDDEEEWDEDDEDWEDEDDEDDDQDYDYLFGDQIIPNPLLDSIDPDGAADRFPELARDPRFWFDMALFIAFLNFLSFAGPRDPFPDIPLY